MNKRNKRIIIATGGTGGHVLPAYNLATHLNSNQFDVEIICDKRGLKYFKNRENLNITIINSSTILNKGLFKLVLSVLIIIGSLFRSILVLYKNKPALVFGMGGYSAFPVCIAARILKIPLIIYENNLHIGKANKYLLPFANKVLISFNELTGIKKAYAHKVSKIGNIIRKEIFSFQSENYYNQNDEILKILVLGGSQAAKAFGEKLPKIFKQCSDIKIPMKIYQQCLPDQNNLLVSYYKNLNIDCEIFNFSDDLLEYFSKVNLAITRSGSSMLAELTNSNIPFISVPLPSSADNHQLKNAIYYQKNEYSYLIEEKELDDKLYELIKLIHKDKSLLKQIKIQQQHYSDKSVYENIDKEIKEIIKNNEEY